MSVRERCIRTQSHTINPSHEYVLYLEDQTQTLLTSLDDLIGENKRLVFTFYAQGSPYDLDIQAVLRSGNFVCSMAVDEEGQTAQTNVLPVMCK